MSRAPLPKKIRDAVLAEYNHLCAVCGSTGPHVHHIDEDAENNDPQNLLPLCPNCHLRDQHNPTRRHEVGKLRLFRRYRDPAVLLPQFHPIYLRQTYLEEVSVCDEPIEGLLAQGTELVEFVEELEMGTFYAKRITELLRRTTPISFWEASPNPELEQLRRDEARDYREKLVVGIPTVQKLLVELLRYQKWANAA